MHSRRTTAWLGGDNMQSVVQSIAGISLGIPLQYADQTAVLHLGHFAPKAAVIAGAHGVTRSLDSLARCSLLVER
jgi:hypothetical protein